MYFVAVSAAVGHSRGRGLLKFASGSLSPSTLNTRLPGQVQWVSEQWSPPAVVPGSTSPVPSGFAASKSLDASSARGALLFSMSPPVPSHSTPTLSLHIKHASGGGNPAQVDLSPSGAVSLSPRFASKRSEAHAAAAVNGDVPIPLVTSASDPLPVPAHASLATPVLRSPTPCLAKPLRVSPPHHVNIQPVLQSSPIASSFPSPRTGQ